VRVWSGAVDRLIIGDLASRVPSQPSPGSGACDDDEGESPL
jgi:hypothetical protein